MNSRGRPSIKCRICKKTDPKPDLYCTACSAKGVPYHTACWDQQVLHDPDEEPSPIHRQILMRDIERLCYLNQPNDKTVLEDNSIEADDANCFIEFDVESSKFQLGPRAYKLHHPGGSGQWPSFVSFVGRTMNGKSFLLRALQQGAPDGFPTPIPAPGSQAYNSTSTSSDIHLYADWETSNSESPILFLDCEGFDGSDTPSSFRIKAKKFVAENAVGKMKLRREWVEDVYPRLLYAFSTCIVFVTSGPLAESAEIGRRLLSYAAQGAGGSQNQGFKPSLFIVFNLFQGGEEQNFDWSVKASTEAFLRHEGLEELRLYYGAINVVYIPSVRKNDADLGLSQIDAFQKLLRQEHATAFRRRQQFGLVFTPDRLTHFLWKALDLFSKNRKSIFDWSIETADQRFKSSDLITNFHDLWSQLLKNFVPEARSPLELYQRTRTAFEEHVKFCLLVGLTRNPPIGESVAVIPKSLSGLIQQIDQLLLDHAPCIATMPKLYGLVLIKCWETKQRHVDHHQGPTIFGVTRWLGHYETDKDTTVRTFREVFEATMAQEHERSLRDIGPDTIMTNIRSLTTCFGCLVGSPSSTLGCGHSFCLDCIFELAKHPVSPHRLPKLRCPFHKEWQQFSPRLLPIQSGYRILSLDGGGVKGFAQLIMLKHIEDKCFKIPTAQLFDLIVGTSIGGQIALALTVPTISTLPSAAAAILQFRDLCVLGGFKLLSSARLLKLVNSTTYNTRKVEYTLQHFFGKDTKLCHVIASPQSSSIPNVAVTTVTQNPSKVHLVTNYNRKATEDSIPLLLMPDPDENMPIWAAARCTSAALPYLKAFLWQGQMLLDGGFQLNCPAVAAFSEASCIWPKKRCDTLVSLGTGIPATSTPPSSNNTLRSFDDAVDVTTSSEFIWANFSARLQPNIFRLNPVYSGGGFALDDFNKLDEIEGQTVEWLARCDLQITGLCDQLIAALFFFVPISIIEDGVQIGEIQCRLPVDLDARSNLVDKMTEDADTDLFVVEAGGKAIKGINVKDSLGSISPGVELRIPVKLEGLPDAGEIAVHIKMRSLGENTPRSLLYHRWVPISGSPFVLRDGSGGRK